MPKQRTFRVVKMLRSETTYLINTEIREDFYVFNPDIAQSDIEERIYNEHELTIEGRYAFYKKQTLGMLVLNKAIQLKRDRNLAASMKKYF